MDFKRETYDLSGLIPRKQDDSRVREGDYHPKANVFFKSTPDDSRARERDYRTIEAAYTALLDAYLCERAGLNEYQELIDKSAYHFAADTTNAYMKRGGFGRKNICVRNKVHVGRLTEGDLSLIRNQTRDNRIAATDELMSMVERTVKAVIRVHGDEAGGPYETAYDIGAFQVNIAPCDALVLGIYYVPDYDNAGNIVSGLKEKKKLGFLSDLAAQMESRMSSALGMKVKVFY